MRGLLAAVLAISGVIALAEARVVHIPRLRDVCPGSDDWTKLTQCISRQSPKHTLLHDEASLKIVGIPEQSRFAGSYVYMRRGEHAWKLIGELRMHQQHELLDVARIRLGRHAAYRLDFGLSAPSSFTIAEETNVAGMHRLRMTVLCLDHQEHCVLAITACDVLVQGKAYFSFRGTLRYEAGDVKLVGDRRNAGPYCMQSETVLRVDGR